MTLFEAIFWPCWLASLWLFQDERTMRFQMWFVDWQYRMMVRAEAFQNGEV